MIHRFGLVLPSSNVVVEDTLRRQVGVIRTDIAFHVARFPVVTVDLGSASTGQFDDGPVDTAIDRTLRR